MVACVCLGGGGGRFMATFMSLPNYRIAMFVFGSDLCHLKGMLPDCKTVTRPDMSVVCVSVEFFQNVLLFSACVLIYTTY